LHTILVQLLTLLVHMSFDFSSSSSLNILPIYFDTARIGGGFTRPDIFESPSGFAIMSKVFGTFFILVYDTLNLNFCQAFLIF
ncbi:MAG: hypothetical protein E6073_04890, partial [Anaerococcus vaginalis]|nr:hypothetical protein [Anaerococcus vaginalis]